MKKGLIVVIILLSIGLIGTTSFIVYDQFIKEEKEEKEPTKSFSDPKRIEELKSLISTIKSCSEGEKLINKFFAGTTVQNLNKQELITLGLLNLETDHIIPGCDSDTTITLDELNQSIGEIVKDASITLEQLKQLSNTGSFGTYWINIDNNNRLIVGNSNCDGCGTEFHDYEVINISNTAEDDNYLYIYEKIAFVAAGVYSEEKDDYYYSYYKDVNRKQLVQTIWMLEKNNVDWEQYNTYTWTFKKSNNNYYLESVKIK